MERRLWVGERAPKPWVGEPGRLSLDDSERFSDDKLRLVCSRFDCLVILRKRELRFLLLEEEERKGLIQRDSKSTLLTTQITVSACYSPLCLSPLLPFFASAPLVPSGHLGLIAALAGWSNPDGGVLKGRGGDHYLISTLGNEQRKLAVGR